jgi:hypothetical protein
MTTVLRALDLPSLLCPNGRFCKTARARPAILVESAEALSPFGIGILTVELYNPLSKICDGSDTRVPSGKSHG